MDVYNISSYEFQNRILKAWRKHFVYDHTSPTFIRETIIVPDITKNPNAISEASLNYGGEMRSNFNI